ncbi:MAG: hypothetical protein EGR45_10945 [Ruminococcaceae bacterium]|nr:hypothetical protein [Oscillospiraceae bacterium]
MAIFLQSCGRFSYTRTGEFRVRCKAETPLTIFFILLIPAGIILVAFLTNDYLKEVPQLGELLSYVYSFWGTLCLFIISAIRAGVTCKYYADQNEFKITDNHKHAEYLFYSDIVSVDYDPIKLFSCVPRGFRVTITTEYRTIVYDYLFFGNFGSSSPEDTPFHLLETRVQAVQEPLTLDEHIAELRDDREGLL